MQKECVKIRFLFIKDILINLEILFLLKLVVSKHIILSRDNEVAQYILQKNQKNYHKSKFQSVYLSKYLGKGLLTVDGDFWLKQRRLIQPAFHKQKMNQLVENMNQTIASELDRSS